MKVTVKPSLHASWIDRDAYDIVKRLQAKGHQTYLVGGCVRDLLCEVHPKDYDIATSALPNEIRKLIHGSYVIGKRFRLVLVKRGDQQFEVATFRRSGRAEDFTEGEDAPIGDNFFGTCEEDAIRRDFSMNALFYDPVKEELLDYPNGLKDVENRILRMIGDPATRIQEDPIRSLRALRLSHKLKFKIDPELRQAIADHSDWVAKSVLPRRREEYLKILRLKEPVAAFLEMWDLNLLQICLPGLIPIFANPERQQRFLTALARANDYILDPSNPVELYVPFVLAVREALSDDGWSVEEEEAFYRLEMGLFKAEWAEIESGLQFRQRLYDIDHFRRRGQRRQQAFVHHPALTMALRMLAYEFELSPQLVQFWVDRLNAVPMPPPPPRGKNKDSQNEKPQDDDLEVSDDDLTLDGQLDEPPDPLEAASSLPAETADPATRPNPTN